MRLSTNSGRKKGDKMTNPEIQDEIEDVLTEEAEVLEDATDTDEEPKKEDEPKRKNKVSAQKRISQLRWEKGESDRKAEKLEQELEELKSKNKPALTEPKEDDYEEVGVEIALEIIEKINSKPGINGMHLMSVGWEAVVPRIISEAGLN